MILKIVLEQGEFGKSSPGHTCDSADEGAEPLDMGTRERQTWNHLMNSHHKFLKRCKEI